MKTPVIISEQIDKLKLLLQATEIYNYLNENYKLFRVTSNSFNRIIEKFLPKYITNIFKSYYIEFGLSENKTIISFNIFNPFSTILYGEQYTKHGEIEHLFYYNKNKKQYKCYQWIYNNPDRKLFDFSYCSIFYIQPPTSKKTGLCKMYNKNNQIIRKGYYNNNKKWGIWNYYKNGKIDYKKVHTKEFPNGYPI